MLLSTQRHSMFHIAVQEILSVHSVHVPHENVGFLIVFLRCIQVCYCPCHWSTSVHFQSTTFRNVVDLRTYFRPHMILWRKIVMAPDGLVGLLVGGMLKSRRRLWCAVTTPFGEYCRLSTVLPIQILCYLNSRNSLTGQVTYQLLEEDHVSLSQRD
jgi:hypothetical protein